jgi:hypothetical protein
MKIASPCISANSREPISPAVSIVSAAQTTKTSAGAQHLVEPGGRRDPVGRLRAGARAD